MKYKLVPFCRHIIISFPPVINSADTRVIPIKFQSAFIHNTTIRLYPSQIPFQIQVSSRFPTLNLIVTLHFKFESHNPICLDIILIQSQLPLYWLYFNSILLSHISVKFVFNSNSLSLRVFKQFTLFKNQFFPF